MFNIRAWDGGWPGFSCRDATGLVNHHLTLASMTLTSTALILFLHPPLLRSGIGASTALILFLHPPLLGSGTVSEHGPDSFSSSTAAEIRHRERARHLGPAGCLAQIHEPSRPTPSHHRIYHIACRFGRSKAFLVQRVTASAFWCTAWPHLSSTTSIPLHSWLYPVWGN